MGSADTAACEHPDSRIVWSDWLDAEWIEERFRVAEERCAACEATLATTALLESEVADGTR